MAGGLGLTIVTTDTRAALEGTATMTDGSDGDSDAGALTITAHEDSNDKADAQPKTVTGQTLGIGASVAWVVGTHNVTAEVADGATLSGKDVAVQADLDLHVDASARSGVGGEDGGGGKLSFTPVAAVALVDSATKARVGTGAATTISGKLDVLSDYFSHIETNAKGATTGTSLAVGASLALTIADENTSASLERSFAAGGNITVQATGLTDDSAAAVASAVGAEQDNGSGTDSSGQNVDARGQAQRTGAETAPMTTTPTAAAAAPAPIRMRRRTRTAAAATAQSRSRRPSASMSPSPRPWPRWAAPAVRRSW